MCSRELLERQRRRDELLVGAHVDAHVAGVHDRRAGDAHMHLARAGLAHEVDERAGGGAADERVVDDNDATPGDVLGERVEFQGHTLTAKMLTRLDERAPDVAVLDEPVVVREAADACVTDGRGNRGVGYGDNDIRVDHRLAGELLAEALAHLVHVHLAPLGIGPREIDELERAPSRNRGGKEGVAAPDLRTLQRHDLAGCHLGDVDAAERAQRTGL